MKKLSNLSLFLLVLCLSNVALATTGSTELNPALVFLQDNLNGTVSKIIVITSLLFGAATMIVKFNIYVLMGCVGTALFVKYAPAF